MGYTRSTFFIVHTTHDTPRIEEARGIALSVFKNSPGLVGPIMRGVINDASGFMVMTSGSKLGWSDADQHEASIADLIALLAKMERPPRWCRVDSGEDSDDLSAEHGEDGNWTHAYAVYKIP